MVPNPQPSLSTADAEPRATATLPRAIGYLGSTAIVVGTIIGSGIFLVPHNVALEVGSVRSLFLVWIVGGVLSLAGALSLAELGAAMPEAGGIYVYLREAYGKLFAFLYGWGMLLVIHSGSAATLAVAFGIYSATFFPLTRLEHFDVVRSRESAGSKEGKEIIQPQRRILSLFLCRRQIPSIHFHVIV